MKNLILSILTVFIFSQLTNAQSSSRKIEGLPKNSIRVSPINFIHGGLYGLEYERVIAKRLSFHAYGEVQFSDIKLVYNDEKVGDGLAYKAGVNLRYYFAKNKAALEGWYAGFGPAISYSSVDVEYDYLGVKMEASTDSTDLGIRSHLGYQWIPNKSGFTVGVDVGGVYWTNVHGNPDEDAFLPTFNFSIGYSW